MRKEEQVKFINQALKRSSVAQDKGAHVEILRDGRIQYSMLGTTGSGRQYRMKVPRAKIMGLMWGEDMRRLNQVLSRK